MSDRRKLPSMPETDLPSAEERAVAEKAYVSVLIGPGIKKDQADKTKRRVRYSRLRRGVVTHLRRVTPGKSDLGPRVVARVELASGSSVLAVLPAGKTTIKKQTAVTVRPDASVGSSVSKCRYRIVDEVVKKGAPEPGRRAPRQSQEEDSDVPSFLRRMMD